MSVVFWRGLRSYDCVSAVYMCLADEGGLHRPMCNKGWVVEVISDRCQEDVDLFRTPTQASSERGHGVWLKASECVLSAEEVDRLRLTCGRGVDRPFVFALDDVGEPDLSHDAAQLIDILQGATKSDRCSPEEPAPSDERVILQGKTHLVGSGGQIHLLYLHVAAGLEVACEVSALCCGNREPCKLLKHILEVVLPIPDAEVHHPTVYVVKGPGEEPRHVDVVNEELAVRRHTRYG